MALLVLNANRTVSTQRLAEDLWGGDPPDGAIRSLRVYVSRLRQAMGAAGEAVVTRPSGYVLRVDADAVDAVRFEVLVARGRDNAKAGDHTGAAAALREALELWRGPALADVAGAPFAQGEARRLEEARLAALEDRIQADLACGRHGELTAELEALTREHPYRERLWSQRIVALYRSARQAEALSAYQELRSTLVEQLGLEPSPPLQQLAGAVLHHDPELDWRPRRTTAPGPFVAGTEGPTPAGAGEGVVTVLFSGLVLDTLGEEAATTARRTHFGLLREAAAAHGGSEVKDLDDGLMVAFASPLAALRGAVEIRKAAARAYPPVRIGLHAGEPMGDDGDLRGTPVDVARRLCDRAEGGQILTSVLVADLIGRRSDEFVFRHLGALPLDGLATPVAACEVVPKVATGTDSSVATAEPGRLPQPLGREEHLPMVGRETELSRLDRDWQATCSGQRRLVLVAGEPGIGKSRLSAEFARTAQNRRALVLFGRCDEDMGVPYQPFVEAFGRYLRQAPRLVLGRLAGELARLVPEVGERVHGLAPPLRSDPETERYRLFDAVAAWLGAVSESVPILFVIDDLHWATKPTLLLLTHLIRSDEDLRLLLLVTVRDTPVDVNADLADLLVELLRLPGVERIRLAGLTASGVGALMEARADHSLDEQGWALARMVHGETAGNPFYVREVLRHLAEQGDIVRRDGRWVAGHPLTELDIPDTVRDVVERRLSRLPNRTSEMLALAAVLGERFDLPVLAEASGEPESSVVQTLGPAVSARLVEETDAGSYHFTHALVRSTLEYSLGPTRRLQLHRAAGSAVEAVRAGRLDLHLPQLAHHFAQARDLRKAIDYASRAGDRALAQLANDEAAAYYRQALELLDAAGRPGDAARRCDLLIALGEAQQRAGDPAYRHTLLDAAHHAQQSGNASALAQAALANNRGMFSVAEAVDAERVAVLEAAIEGTGPDESPLRARLLATLASEMAYSPDHQRRHHLASEALALARRLADRPTLGYVLALRPSSIWAPTTVQDRFDNATELADLADEVGDPRLAFWARLWRAIAAMEMGEGAGADDVHLAIDLAAELGQPTLQWIAGYLGMCRLLLSGRIDDAETQAHEAYRIGEAAGAPDAFRYYGTQLFWVRFEQGRLDEVVGLLERGARRSGASPLTRAALALALCEIGRHDEARPLVTELTDGAFVDAPYHYLSLLGLTMVAAAVGALGDRTLAKPTYEQLLPHSAAIPCSGLVAIGSVHHYLGCLASVLGRFRDSEIHFAAAAATHDRIGAPTWLARTRLEWARMLLARLEPGDADRSGELIGQALAAGRDLGMAKVERDAAALLR